VLTKNEQEGYVQEVKEPELKSNHKPRTVTHQTRNNAKIREYIDHVEKGISIRKIAKRDGVHPSTVMRRIRKIESKREDPLLDDALNRICDPFPSTITSKEVTMNISHHKFLPEAKIKVQKDMLRVLRRLSENNSFMVMSLDLAKAVVMRGTGKAQVRSAVLSRELGQKLLLKDWIECTCAGKFNKYKITSAGRLSLKRMVSELAMTNQKDGFAEASSPFLEQHREWGHRTVTSPDTGRREHLRVNLRESPLNMLGRKKNKDGKPFLANELLQAGERLREDFELAQLGPRVTQNWDRFMLGTDRGNFGSNEGGGASAAQSRLSKALTALGPGLGDIALRCCCFLEGMEAAEKRMGWSARSGKIVLSIALQRLRMHYDEAYSGVSDRIG
jgi:hypothetical protein